MKYVDLHVHSTASDGSFHPAEIVHMAEEIGLSAMALTDHDTVDGVEEALREADSLNVEVIPGIELSSVYNGTEIHILGLFINHKDPELLSVLAGIRRQREERNDEMIRLFAKQGIILTREDLTAGNENTVITRAHFGRALRDHGIVSSVDQAFKKYLSPGCCCYVPKAEVSPEKALSILRNAGAFPVLAHPTLYHMGWKEIEDLIIFLKSLGLRGLECFHSSNNQLQSGKLMALADKYALCPTGGSDFHGAAKPDISLGTGRGNLKVSAMYLDTIRLSMFLL